MYFNFTSLHTFLAEWALNWSCQILIIPNQMGWRNQQWSEEKRNQDSGDFYLALLHLRNTDQEELPSPAKLFMPRFLRTNIPISSNLLQPSICIPQEIQGKILALRLHSKIYNKTSVKPTQFYPHQLVMFQKKPGSLWSPGTVVNLTKEPRYMHIKTEDGVLVSRNTTHATPVKTSSLTDS